MTQICYNYEILLELQNKECHIRELARILKTNSMRVSRNMKQLMDDNIVDYKKEGKNKVYSIKKSLESKNSLLLSEIYKLLRLISSHPDLRKIIERLQSCRAEMVIIFGSYAKGTAKLSSDVDIYIETVDISIKEELLTLDSRLSIKIGRYDKDNLLIKEIIKNHVIVKGFEKYYGKVFEEIDEGKDSRVSRAK